LKERDDTELEKTKNKTQAASTTVESGGADGFANPV
jgi:hypothetical protein